MKDVLVSIGGGTGQLPLIEAARRIGLDVVVVDRDPRAPGAASAGGRVVASTHDPAAVLRGLCPLLATRRPRAVATKSSGTPVATCARVARALGLPGLEPAAAELAVTKPGQMELARRAGLRVPRSRALHAPEDLPRIALGWPRVLKPALTRVGKAGITRADCPADLPAAFEAARTASADGRVEVEEFVPGEDVVLAGLFADSELSPVALLDEALDFDAAGRARGLGFALPSVQGMAVLADVVTAAQRLVGRLGLGHGIGFFSFRVTPGEEPCLIEMHFDLAGDFVADKLFGAATSFDLIAESLRLLAGEPWSARPSRLAPTALRFLFAGELDGRRADVLARLRALPGVLEVASDPAAGSGGDARVGYALVRGSDARDTADRARAVDGVLGRGPGAVPGRAAS